MKEALARNSNGQYEITLGGSNWKLDNGNLINIDAIDSDLVGFLQFCLAMLSFLQILSLAVPLRTDWLQACI